MDKAGNKTGGRKKGSRNQRTVELQDELRAFRKKHRLDHPVIGLLKIGYGLVKLPTPVFRGKVLGTVIEELEASPDLKVTCLKEAAQYESPKLSALRFVDKAGDDRDVPAPVAWSTLVEDPHVQEFLHSHGEAVKRARAPAKAAAKPKAGAGKPAARGKRAPRPNW